MIAKALRSCRDGKAFVPVTEIGLDAWWVRTKDMVDGRERVPEGIRPPAFLFCGRVRFGRCGGVLFESTDQAFDIVNDHVDRGDEQ